MKEEEENSVCYCTHTVTTGEEREAEDDHFTSSTWMCKRAANARAFSILDTYFLSHLFFAPVREEKLEEIRCADTNVM